MQVGRQAGRQTSSKSVVHASDYSRRSFNSGIVAYLLVRGAPILPRGTSAWKPVNPHNAA